MRTQRSQSTKLIEAIKKRHLGMLTQKKHNTMSIGREEGRQAKEIFEGKKLRTEFGGRTGKLM